jgi:hypothetical protein
MDFRESHTGTVAGITRWSDHLDDMPALWYLTSAMWYDRTESFWALLYGHTANYAGEREKEHRPPPSCWPHIFYLPPPPSSCWPHIFYPPAGRGTFTATEQLPIYDDSLGVSRDYLWSYLEGGIDECVPSIMITGLGTMMQLVMERYGE